MLGFNSLTGFGAGQHSYQAVGVDFDGATYLSRGTDLTGNADNAQGVFSGWFRIDGGDGTARQIWYNTGGHVSISLGSDNKFRFDLSDNAGSAQLTFATVATFLAGASWIHILASWDATFSAGNKLTHLYVNNASDKAVSSDASSAFSIDYTTADHALGAQLGGSSKFNGCMADLYFAPGQYLDFSNAADRAKFIDPTTLRPVSLGADGGLPTGVAPRVYLNGAAAHFTANAGTGGNFTVTAGALTAASTNP